MKNITLKWWELMLLMVLSGLSAAIFSDIAHAGSILTNLTETTTIINVDEKKRADDALEKAKKDADKVKNGAMVFTGSSVIESTEVGK